MNLFTKLKKRKEATYVLTLSERRKIRKNLEEANMLISKVSPAIGRIESLRDFYDHNSKYPRRKGVRTPMEWSEFDHVVTKLVRAHNVIHKYPFKDNDDVYPPYYPIQIRQIDRSIYVWFDMAFNSFGLHEILVDSKEHLSDEENFLYYTHFGIMLHYIAKYYNYQKLFNITLFKDDELEIIESLLLEEEKRMETRHFSNIREREDLSS